MNALNKYASPSHLKWLTLLLIYILMFSFLAWQTVLAITFSLVGIVYITSEFLIPIMHQNSWPEAEIYQNTILNEDQHFFAGKIALLTVFVSIILGSTIGILLALPFCLFSKWLIKKIYHVIR